MNFTCEVCSHEFVRQKTFEDHFCEGMQKQVIFKLPIGQAAFFYYKKWLLLSKKNSHVTEETFLKSKYFLSFIKFIKFSNTVMLPDRLSYITYMIKFSILPIHWCMTDMYISFIKYLDVTYTPLQHVEQTIKTLTELSTIFNCTIDNVFRHLKSGDCINLLRSRKLSPWLLLLSAKFKTYIATDLTKEQQNLISETIINPNLWNKRFTNNSNDVAIIKKTVSDLKL